MPLQQGAAGPLQPPPAHGGGRWRRRKAAAEEGALPADRAIERLQSELDRLVAQVRAAMGSADDDDEDDGWQRVEGLTAQAEALSDKLGDLRAIEALRQAR